MRYTGYRLSHTRTRVKHSVGAATLLQECGLATNTTISGSSPNPHTGKAGYQHKCQQNRVRLSPRETQHFRDQDAVDVRLTQGRRDSKTANEEHNCRRKHACEREPTAEYFIGDAVERGVGVLTLLLLAGSIAFVHLGNV